MRGDGPGAPAPPTRGAAGCSRRAVPENKGSIFKVRRSADRFASRRK